MKTAECSTVETGRELVPGPFFCQYIDRYDKYAAKHPQRFFLHDHFPKISESRKSICHWSLLAVRLWIEQRD